MTEWEEYCLRDSLDEYLRKTPESKWSKKDQNGLTLLHYACLGKNKITSLLPHVNIDTRTKEGATPLHFAVLANNPYMVNELCKHGASVRFCEPAPLDFAIPLAYTTCAKLLIAFGDRLECFTPIKGLIPFVLKKDLKQYLILRTICAQFTVRAIESNCGNRVDTSELQVYQQNVDDIRQLAVTLMGLRKFRNVWFQMDRFLVREIAKTLWKLRLPLL